MLPDVCIIDDVYRPPVVPLQPTSQTAAGVAPAAASARSARHCPDDDDETLVKRRSFTNEYSARRDDLVCAEVTQFVCRLGRETLTHRRLSLIHI